MTAASRIVYADESLAPLARILSDEIYLSTALRLKAVAAPSEPGDISLQLDPQLKGEQYTLNVADSVVVRGGNYRAQAWGTATCLQAIESSGAGEFSLPKMNIEDEPIARYRGLLIDTAREWHPVETLRPIVQLCRLYKINFLQLHLNDQQSTVFPSTAFPQLASSTKGQRRTYTQQEMTELIKFADERGVAIVPELEGPGHHSGNLRQLWGRGNTLDVYNEKTYEGLNVLIGELCNTFKSSPYIHIGADEGSFGHLGKSPEEQAYMQAHGLKGGPLEHYIERLDKIVKGYGKKTICWEGFGGKGGNLPRDIIVMPFESAYNPSDKLVKSGFSVINTAWKPLYVVGSKKWPAEYIYEKWNLWLWEHHVNTKCHIQLKETDPVLGAQMCAWEQQCDVELPSTRERIHAMSERIWNPHAEKTFADFAARAVHTDLLLNRMLGIIDVHNDGLAGLENRGFNYFTDSVVVTLKWPSIGTARYTLDGKDPNAESLTYAGPIKLTKDSTSSEKLFYNRRIGRHEATGRVVRVKARIFDASNKPIGDVVTLCQYWFVTAEELEKAKQDKKLQKDE